MSILLVSYIFNSLVLVSLGYLFLKRYKNLGGIFFFLFSLATAAWFILYILSFFSTTNIDLILYFGRGAYFTSIISLYSFLLFISYFEQKKSKSNKNILVIFLIFILFLGSVYMLSPYIIEGLYFDSERQDWYELEGKLYFIHLVLSFLFVPLSIFLSTFRLKRLSTIDKRRLQYILYGMIGFVVLCFVFLLILPMFGVWTLEKYIAFFFMPFMLAVFYAIRRYDFLNLKIAFLKSFIFSYALICAFLLSKITHQYITSFSYSFHEYWGVNTESFFVEILVAIVSFLFIYNFVENKALAFFTKNSFSEKLEEMKNHIPYLTDIQSLDAYLKKQFQHFFHIDYISLETDSKNINPNLSQYFAKDTTRNIFMNDIVFLEENKNKFMNAEDAISLDSRAYLIFPLRNRQEDILGLFSMGNKPLKDPFYTGEIKTIKGFVGFLSAHLKYISIYSQIRELTVTLDKKVDEKTIEYNNLINKQKDFISYVGHEIKNPITNTIFLCDGLQESLSEMKDGKDMQQAREDSEILYGELKKVADLVKHVFSTEKFDLNKVKLYKKHTNISEFLDEEVRVFESKYPNVFFKKDITYIEELHIDRVQFRQVIANLLTNAVKFSCSENTAKILVGCKKVGSKVQITVEDNGDGFSDIDISNMFEKYSTGNGNSIGLGMGLYLCKKIIELHGGEIIAEKSPNLGGARFILTL